MSFITIDNNKPETSTRRERFVLFMASVGGAVLIVTGIALVMLYM